MSEPVPPNPDDDERLFALLNRYVDLLHSDDVESRSVLCAKHPELDRLLACLESLDSLAVTERLDPTRDDRVEDDEDQTPTVQSLWPDSQGILRNALLNVPNREQEFGKYQLLGELGRGGMGVVYRARQTDLDRDVAIKMILSNQFASDDEIRRFYAEARAAGRLRHPNIVGIHEVGEIHGQHYFAMDCVDGSSLARRLDAGPIDPREAAACLAAVARAVHYLHENGIIHRDLKPSNILLDAAGKPCVTDFGLAKVFDADTGRSSSGMIVGTPGYMSPEQAAGEIEVISPKSDIYSLGAILYRTLTGQAPFAQSHPLHALIGSIEGDPPVPRTLNPAAPRDLQAICLRCLEKNPADRYPTAAALAEDLERYVAGEQVDARATGWFQKLRRWARRETALASRWVAIGLAALIVQIKFSMSGYDNVHHAKVMSIFAVWAVVAFVFQKLLFRPGLAYAVRFTWAAADAALLTLMLSVNGPPVGPLVVGYPLLVAASGLFFRVRLVWFTTVAAMISYGFLVASGVEQTDPPHYPLIFAAALAVVGFITAYQVERVRILSRYYEQRRGT